MKGNGQKEKEKEGVVNHIIVKILMKVNGKIT